MAGVRRDGRERGKERSSSLEWKGWEADGKDRMRKVVRRSEVAGQLDPTTPYPSPPPHSVLPVPVPVILNTLPTALTPLFRLLSPVLPFLRPMLFSTGPTLGGHSPSSFQPCTSARVKTSRLIGTLGVRPETMILEYISGYRSGEMRFRIG